MNLKTKIVLLALHNALENKKLNVNDYLKPEPYYVKYNKRRKKGF